jgi:maltooligosyltrehalose trehalohydrolase
MLGGADDRLVVVNLGPELSRASIPDPLVAPPRGFDWQIGWSSEEPVYGGSGTPNIWPEDRWDLPAESAIVLVPAPLRERAGKVRRRTA